MEGESTNAVKMDKDISVTAVSEGSADFIRIKQEVDLPEDDTYYPMDFGISVEDEEEMNPVYVKMKSKEPGSSGTNLARDGSKLYDEEDSEESEEESEEESDEDSSNSGEDKSGEEDGERGWINNSGVQGEEMQQPSTSKYSPAPTMTGMTSVAIKEEPMSEDEGAGLSYQEDDDQFAESYKMLDSLRRSCGGEGAGQSSRDAMFDSLTTAFEEDDPFTERQENFVTMSQEQGKQESRDMVRMDSNLPHSMGFRKSAEPFQRLGLDEPLTESSDSYTCELCRKPCGNRTNYFVHLRIKHAEELPYECGICEIRFSTETILRDHILTSHTGEKKDIVKCHVCGAMFREKHYLHAHMLTHNEYSPFPCHICRKTFIKKKDLQKHIYSHEETKTFPCPMCKRVYQQARYLEVHLRRPCNPYICQDCSKKPQVPEDPASNDHTTELGRTSISKENCTEQEEVPTATEQQLSCKICGTAFARLEDSTGHKCKVYQCSVCSKNFCPSLLAADGKARSSEETPVCDTCSQEISLSDKVKKEQSASTVVEKTVHCQVCLKKMPKPIFKACAVKETTEPPQRFSCRICGYTYFRRWSLLKHVKVHEREHKYLCATCDTVFNKKKAYRRHMKIHEARRHKCSECNETFSKEKHLEKHKQLHSEASDHEYICATCGMVFNEKKAYRQHRKIHGLKRKKCSTCNETFSKKKHLEKHKQLQLEGYNVCNRFSNSKNKREKHKCQVCSKYFIHIKNLIKHEKSHLLPVEKYTCVECWKSFPLKSMLKDHMKIHERTSKPSTEYVCNICKLSCVNELHLYNHKRIHAGFKISACDICGKSFNRRYDLIEHRESVHSQFMCKICGKGFPSTGELEVHNKDKHAEDHLVCNICDKVCVNQLHLKNHCLIHAGRKLSVCEFCGCGFTRRYNLVKHMESHTGQKPHCCDICHEGFSETSDLLLHRKIHDEDHPGLVIGDDFIKKEDSSQ